MCAETQRKATQRLGVSGICKCACQGSENVLSPVETGALTNPLLQGLLLVSSAEDKMGQRAAGRAGEAKGELTFCAPRRRGSDMKH